MGMTGRGGVADARGDLDGDGGRMKASHEILMAYDESPSSSSRRRIMSAQETFSVNLGILALFESSLYDPYPSSASFIVVLPDSDVEEEEFAPRET